MTNTLISIIGPTAIGKTALSIQLARHFKTDIISADSRQFYKEMHIGTAVPSEKELHAAQHYFIQNKSIKESYSVGDFERDAMNTIDDIHKTNPTVIMVGGSGLYVNAVTKGFDKFPEAHPNIRVTLNQRLENEGLSSLAEQLKSLDLKAYETIALDNPHRVIRALEICIASEKPYSSFLTKSTKKRPFKTISIGLDAERSIIYDRINQRVDLMLENGLLDEAKALLPFKELNALNTVGYKELFAYLEGNSTLEFAISEIKKNTRRFAKRQLTWFKKDETATWYDYKTNTNTIIDDIERSI